MERLLQDIRFSIRSLLRSRGFTAVALLTLALGIGANTAMFSVVYGVLLRPLPYANAGSLVRLYQANPGQNLQDASLALADVEDWQDRTRSFTGMAASMRRLMVLTEPGEATEVEGSFVTEEFFAVLGARPRLGVGISADDVRQARRIAVISDRLWKARFSSDIAVVGKTFRLVGRPYTIVGVMGPDFRYPTPATDVWAPQTLLVEPVEIQRQRGARMWEGVARLRDGTTADQARAELNIVSEQLATENPQTNRGWTAATVVPLRESIVGNIDNALLVVFGVVGFTLLIGCVNLANLLLARGAGRAGEMAIRTALGASRLRILRQILTESVVLALLGGVMGIVLAMWGTQALLALSADTLPRVDDVRLDARVVRFGLLLAVVTGLLFGLLPALRAASDSPQEHLRGGRGAVGTGHRIRTVLVVAEVGLAVVLVIGAGLMARSFVALRNVDSGFDATQVLAVTLQFNLADRPAQPGDQLTPEVMKGIFARLLQRRNETLERFTALPSVVEAGAINGELINPAQGSSFDMESADGSRSPDQQPVQVQDNVISSRYLQAMGIPLRRGELLPDQPPAAGAMPILLSESAARRLWPNEDPIGRLVRRAGTSWTMRVTGVVGDVRRHGLSRGAEPAVYLPQAVGPNIVTTYVLRTTGDPVALHGMVRNAVTEMNRNQPIRTIATLSDVMAETIARDRFFFVLFQIFGGLALLLAAVGVYGVLAYTIGQRTKEIGLRMSLGADATNVLRMVIGGGMRPVLIGLAIGGIAAFWLTGLLAGQLFGITTTDPVTFIAAPAALAVVALVACYVPARWAMRIDPIAALRDN